ncbi:MAG TPA: efflux RND transporter periplasmic adaptor subunit [Bacteroidales bacterium]|nr:efflux RND transporter periplasmic adaptor subunit [Bacteroidales bacterium]
MTKFKYRTFLVMIISALLLTAACNSDKKVNVQEMEEEVLPEDIVELREDQIKLAQIEMGSVELISLKGLLKVNGIVSVSPQNLATVCMPMNGFIKSTSLLPGNAVTKGQTLAILESPDFIELQQSYLETKNKYEYAEAEYKRHSELYLDEVYSQKNMQQVASDYKTLKAQSNALKQKLALIGINAASLTEDNISSSVALISPITGYIKSINVNIGKYVATSDVLFEIVNSDKLSLELTLFEKDAEKVSKGQKIRFFINNETEQHEASIYQTGKSIDADKTYKVYANVVGTCKNILPGMYVNAVIETSGNKVTALPSEAIVSFDDKEYIFVFDKNKEEDGKPFTEYRMIEVHKGITDNGYTEIILPEGFDANGKKVVIKGAYNLLSAKKNAGEMAC